MADGVFVLVLFYVMIFSVFLILLFPDRETD